MNCSSRTKRKGEILQRNFVQRVNNNMTASKVQSISQRSIPFNKASQVQNGVTNHATPPVTRRCLFGIPDPQELNEVFQRRLEHERQRAIKKYGFDVKTESYVNDTEQQTTSASHENDCEKVTVTTQNQPCKSTVNNSSKCNKLNCKVDDAGLKSPSPKKPYDRNQVTKQTILTGRCKRFE